MLSILTTSLSWPILLTLTSPPPITHVTPACGASWISQAEYTTSPRHQFLQILIVASATRLVAPQRPETEVGRAPRSHFTSSEGGGGAILWWVALVLRPARSLAPMMLLGSSERHAAETNYSRLLPNNIIKSLFFLCVCCLCTQITWYIN